MTDPSPKPTSRRPALIALALIAGIAIGVGAVYVSGGFPGNAGSDACKAAVDTAEGLGKAATGTLAGFEPAVAPRNLGSLDFLDADGTTVTIADFRGKTVLLNLWATWCAPCRAEMPSLNALEDKRGSDDFQVVAVSVDTKQDGRAERFFKDEGIDHLTFFVEPTLKLFNTLKENGLAYGMPTTLLIAPNGCHLGSLNGPAEWDAPEALALIDAAVGGAAGARN